MSKAKSGAVLVLNAGSSSLKFMVQSCKRPMRGQIEGIGGSHPRMIIGADKKTTDLEPNIPMGAALQTALKELPLKNLAAVGHRVVHGGTHFKGAVKIDDSVIKKIESLVPLAPLHNPGGLAGIQASFEALPELRERNVACFDTAFHANMLPQCYTYAVPWQLAEDLGIRRYGFHGLSVEYVYQRTCDIVGLSPDRAHVLICHLGAGCSATAVQKGVSLDTSMGLTPLDGLVMGTRSGAVDPGLFQYIAAQTGMSEQEITRILNKESGLKGISGVSEDMRVILDLARNSGDAEVKRRCALARDVFVHRVCQTIASMWVDMARLDALVFTGGVGENSAEIRRMVVDKWGYRGLLLDNERNDAPGVEGVVSLERSASRVCVVKTNEEQQIAEHTRDVLGMEQLTEELD